MQIVQVMYGMQLCTSSVKVSWQRVFPDDGHEDTVGTAVDHAGEGSEDVAESFPIPMALKGPKGSWVHVQASPSEDAADTVDASGSNRQSGSPAVRVGDDTFGINITAVSGDSSPGNANKYPATLALDDDELFSASSSTTTITGGAALATSATNPMSKSSLLIRMPSTIPDLARDATAGFTRPRLSKGVLKGTVLAYFPSRVLLLNIFSQALSNMYAN